jgi:integrase
MGLSNAQARFNFVESLKSAKTKENYIHSVGYLQDFLKVSRDDYLSLLTGDPLLIQSRIIDFITCCKSKGLAPATIHVNLAAVKHFYEMNDIELKWKKIHRYEGEMHRVVEDRAYTHDEIKRMVDVADIRDKALVLLLASTGMRLGAIPPLQIKDLSAIEIEGFSLYQIEVYKRYKESYITYCTPEARQAIDSYLEYRRRSGERLQDRTPLFRKLFDKYDSIQVAHPVPVADSTIKHVIEELLIKTGIRLPVRLTEEEIAAGKTAKRTVLPAIHGFRKFAITNMIRAKLEYNARERIVGHTLKTLDLNYDRREQEELLQEYIKALDYLTISSEKRLAQENQILQIDRSRLEERIDRLEQTFSKFLG